MFKSYVTLFKSKKKKNPALVFNLSACADISPDTKEIHLFYWNTLLGRTCHFWTLLLDLTFGHHFWTLLWTLILDITFGHHFWKDCIYVQASRAPCHRVSKSYNHAIRQLHKLFENLRKFRTNARQPGKTGTNVVYLPLFNNIFQFHMFLMSFFTYVSAQNFQSDNFDCTNKFAFRKCALSEGWL